LRRVLLSSLQGAAITSVKIGGVLHEFSTIPGVHEDVADIVLNLKEVRLRMHGEGPKVLRVHQKGQGVLRAKDLSDDPTVEVMNPDKKIATLSADADVELELTVDTGKGYVGAEKNKSEDMPIGTIPIDSIFSPVTQGQLLVTPARVGRETDFDRPVDRDLDRRHDRAGGRARVRREDPQGAARDLHQLRGAARGAPCRIALSRVRSTRTCSSRSTSSSCRCARRTACRTRTSG
jgi:hypothetical protein